MIIKVCGLREPDNIRQVAELGVDLIGMIFYEKSPRCVHQIRSLAGSIPDRSNMKSLVVEPKRVGVFVDDMPQTIITRIYNYELDYVQLHGDESATMIDNLRRSVDPDIRKGIKVIKALSIASEQDVKRWREYQGAADMLLFDTKGAARGGNGKRFDWSLLDAYDGDIPFLLSGGIDIDDADDIKAISHPMLAGVDLNSRFETEPGVKDVEKLREFINRIRE